MAAFGHIPSPIIDINCMSAMKERLLGGVLFS